MPNKTYYELQRDMEIQASPIGVQRYVQELQDVNHPSIVVGEMVDDLALVPQSASLNSGLDLFQPLTSETLADIGLRVILTSFLTLQHTTSLKTSSTPYTQLIRKVGAKLSSVYDILQVSTHGTEILSVYLEPEVKEQINAVAVAVVSSFVIHLEEFEVESRSSTVPEHNHITRMLTVTRSEVIDELLRTYDRFTSIHRPLLCKPRDWTTTVDGGYLTPSMALFSPYVKKKTARTCINQYSEFNIDSTLKTSNKLQSVAYRVHEDVYAAVYAMMLGGIEIPFMPHTVTRKEGFYDDLDVPEEYKGELPKNATPELISARGEFWADFFDARKSVNSVRGKELLGSTLMDLLYQYAGNDLYYVWNVDYRGRQYPAHTTLSPMGSKVARGLLRFAKTKPVGNHEGAAYLARHIANAAGHDKLPIDVRTMWTYINSDLLLSIAADPVGMREEWMHKDEPTEFLQGCFEWAGYTEQGYAFESSIKGAVDFATSGLGILASLTGDAASGKLTNLTDDDLQDIYSDILTKGMNTLHTRHLTGELDAEATAGVTWLSDNRPEVFKSRLLAKRAVMITPYDGKFISQFEEVKMLLRKWGIKSDMPTELFSPTVAAISKAIWESIPEEIPGAIRALQWMKSLVSDIVYSDKDMLPAYDKDGRPTGKVKLQPKRRMFMWTNPQGFPVFSDFRKQQSIQATGTDYKGNTVYSEFYISTPIADVAKFKSSISANYIHSQDSSVLSKIVNSCDFEMSCIHDSFACHVSDGPAMEEAIRESYIENFANGEGVLQKLKSELLECAPEGFTHEMSVPWIGDLDLQGVRNAKYLCH